MKKKSISKSLKLNKSSIAGLADKKVEMIQGGNLSDNPQLCPTFIPIQCLITDRSCNFTETFRVCPV